MKRGTISILISIFIVMLLSGCTSEPSESFENGGVKNPVIVPRGNYTRVILDFKVTYGSIGLYVNNHVEGNSSSIVNVTNSILIRKGSGVDFNNAENVSYSELNTNTVKISFDSKDEGLPVNYEYCIAIAIAENILLQIDISTIRGELNVDIFSPSISIESFDLCTYEGTIDGHIGELEFSDPFPTIKGAGGIMSFFTEHLRYTTSIAWDISNVGGINLIIEDDFFFSNDSRVHTFDIADEGGDVRVTVDLYQDYGLRVVTSILNDKGSGEVTIPGGGESFTSENFDSASTKYDFDISAWNADIIFVR